jgi:hypothetical protein
MRFQKQFAITHILIHSRKLRVDVIDPMEPHRTLPPSVTERVIMEDDN